MHFIAKQTSWTSVVVIRSERTRKLYAYIFNSHSGANGVRIMYSTDVLDFPNYVGKFQQATKNYFTTLQNVNFNSRL